MLNPRFFASILLSGLLAGLFFSLVQSLEAQPLLEVAERLELRQLQPASTPTPAHDHAPGANPPADASLRLLLRHFSNSLMGIGYALLLATAILGHRLRFPGTQSHPLDGLYWGLLGYLSFFLAPAWHFPPSTPATDLLRHGDEHHLILFDQLGWLGIALCTALGILLLTGRRWRIRLLGVLLLSAPHLALGWLLTDVAPPSPPALRLFELTEQNFRYVTSLGNLIFWLLLGVLTALSVNRFGLNHPAGEPPPEQAGNHGMEQQ